MGDVLIKSNLREIFVFPLFAHLLLQLLRVKKNPIRLHRPGEHGADSGFGELAFSIFSSVVLELAVSDYF